MPFAELNPVALACWIGRLPMHHFSMSRRDALSIIGWFRVLGTGHTQSQLHLKTTCVAAVPAMQQSRSNICQFLRFLPCLRA